MYVQVHEIQCHRPSLHLPPMLNHGCNRVREAYLFSVQQLFVERTLGVAAELVSRDSEIDGSHSANAWYCGLVNWHF